MVYHSNDMIKFLKIGLHSYTMILSWSCDLGSHLGDNDLEAYEKKKTRIIRLNGNNKFRGIQLRVINFKKEIEKKYK